MLKLKPVLEYSQVEITQLPPHITYRIAHTPRGTQYVYRLASQPARFTSSLCKRNRKHRKIEILDQGQTRNMRRALKVDEERESERE